MIVADWTAGGGTRTTGCTPAPTDHVAREEEMARPERFELPTARFVAEYSIQLSYGRYVWWSIIQPRCTTDGELYGQAARNSNFLGDAPPGAIPLRSSL